MMHEWVGSGVWNDCFALTGALFVYEGCHDDHLTAVKDRMMLEHPGAQLIRQTARWVLCMA